MTSWSPWSTLTTESDGWRFCVQRPSEAVDWYRIPASDGARLAAYLGIEWHGNLEPDERRELIERAWEASDSKTLDGLRSASIGVARIGTWIPYGDYGFWYEEGEVVHHCAGCHGGEPMARR